MRNVYCDIQSKQRDLTAVPTRFPIDTQLISLNGNQISTIPVGAFSKVRQLRHLYLASNELQSLPGDVFQGLSNLESLNLANNRLNSLPSGLLRGLSSLRDLYLDGNVLENLPKKFFDGLTSLRRLFLHDNNFQKFSDQVLGFRGEIQNIRINNKKTTSVTPAMLGNITSLVTLTLNHNGIANVQYGSFNRLSVLKRLKLNDNNISTLPRGLFRDLKSLSLLSLYNNPFECTCALKWLKDWILQNRRSVTVFHRDRIICNGPSKVRGKRLLNVKDDEFGCKSKQWTKWSSWSKCTKTCGIGNQHRARNCTRGPGKCIRGITKQWRVCNTRNCSGGSEWSSWTPCSVTCSFGNQRRNRSMTCVRSPCPKRLGTEIDVRVCLRKACPSFTEWSSWSNCDAACGAGRQTRTRACSSSQDHCSGLNNDTRDCKIKDCAQWGIWSSWSTCTKNCSDGVQTRTRDCIVVRGVNEECSGNRTEQRRCNLGECPVHGGWSSWLPWSGCSKTCGFGVNKRFRKCSNPFPQHGGAACTGSPVEFVLCIQSLCKNGDLSWFTPWSEWSKCSTDCGTGTQARSRNCTKLDPVSGIAMCIGNTKEYRQCHMNKCITKSVWGQWSRWGECYGDCNQGLRFRWRFCMDSRGFGGQRCNGNKAFEFQQRQCTPTSCRYVPVWSTWSNWSGCSKSCASGSKRRKRFCLTRVIGQECPGPFEDKTPCNPRACPVDGGWSAWSDWGKCSQPCSGGIQQRNRTCTNPVPMNNGQQCIGDRSEVTICNEQACRVDVMSDNRKTQTTEKPDIHLKSPKCPEPKKQIKHGKYYIKKQRDDYTYLEYKCDDFYRNRGHSTIRHCMNTGDWSGEEADCVPDCGEIKTNGLPEDRMVDKSITYLNESWPWQAALYDGIKYVCAGSLLRDQWIITAAHCVLDRNKILVNRKKIKVYLGLANLGKGSFNSPEVQVFSVMTIHHHNQFQSPVFDSDIAILKLEKKVQITANVHPVCLPKSRRRKQLIREGKIGLMIGWGSQKNPQYMDQIRFPVVNHRTCKESLKGYEVTKKMLCAGYNSKQQVRDTCKGDSGGGFLFLDKRGRKARWILGGVVSWGHPICGKGKYSVFTNVAKHISWITDKIAEK